MKRFRYLSALLIAIIFSLPAFSQNDSLLEVKGLPTKQVYDLMFDSRNFLWIGHELGLTRFDGINFTKFSCPEMNSTGLSNLMEDKQGRIWCRNFTSQVFYIEKEKMHLLDAYRFADEPRFPQMTIIGDYLVATSLKGLFVLNTQTFKSHYVTCANRTPTSFSKLGNRLVVYAKYRFFEFNPQENENMVSELTFSNSRKEAEDIVLQEQAFNDTMYSFSSRRNSIDKLILTGNKIQLSGTIPNKGIFHTLTFSGSNYWLNTVQVSQSLDGKEFINGYSLTDIVIDKEGNSWMSSWMNGLFVKYHNYWRKIRLPFLNTEEEIIRIEKNENITVYATSQSALIIEDEKRKQPVKKVTLPVDGSLIQYMKFIDSNRVLITTTLRIYILHVNSMTIENLTHDYNYISLKSAVMGDSAIFAAAATGLYELIHQQDSLGLNYMFRQITTMRSRWVEYNRQEKKLIVAFKDGLFYMKDTIPVPVLYKNELIPAVSLLQTGNITYISTISGELYKWDGKTVTKLNLLSELRSYPINSIREYHDTIWLLGADFIKMIDPRTDKSITSYIYPGFPNARIFDLNWYKGKLVLLTNKGMYGLFTDGNNDNYKIKGELLKISVNGRDTIVSGKLKLSHNNNSLGFYLAAPFYTSSEQIYFKYRLIGSGNVDWINGENGVTSFLFSSLRPGNYTFEAIAVHTQFEATAEPVRVQFTILPVWYETNLFKLFFSLLIASAIVLPMGMYFRIRLKQQRANYEKQLAIQHERERISEEIHDDIGAGLSGLRLFTEMAASKLENPEAKGTMNRMFASISELSNKMQDVIWSLNSRNDTLETLLRYIQKQAYKLFGNSGIKLVIDIPPGVPELQLMSDTRTDIYLMVKEALHNVLKHSGADLVTVGFDIRPDELVIKVADNGKGYAENVQPGNGMLNMRKRIARLGGNMITTTKNGVIIEFSIPIKRFPVKNK